MSYTCLQDVYRLQTDDFDEPETLEALTGLSQRLGKRQWKHAQTPVIYVGSGEGERPVLSSFFSTWEFHYPDLSIEFNAWGEFLWNIFESNQYIIVLWCFMYIPHNHTYYLTYIFYVNIYIYIFRYIFKIYISTSDLQFSCEQSLEDNPGGLFFQKSCSLQPKCWALQHL